MAIMGGGVICRPWNYGFMYFGNAIVKLDTRQHWRFYIISNSIGDEFATVTRDNVTCTMSIRLFYEKFEVIK